MPAPLAAICKAAQSHGANIVGADLRDPAWDQIAITNAAGVTVCAIDRNEVDDGTLGEAEIEEFQSEIAASLPASAAAWLKSYLDSVGTVYAIQGLSGTEEEGGWEILASIKEALLSSVGGILQADNEGFSNEEGYHILWQFSNDVTGEWWMAVLKDGHWQKFKMDLGSQVHRAAFKAGEIPAGVERR